MKTLQELQPLIIEWANNKGLINPEFAPRQELKLLEEIGELSNAIINNNVAEQKDAIGDIFVVLVILYAQKNEELEIDLFDLLEAKPAFEAHVYLKNIIQDTRNNFILLNLYKISQLLNLDISECVNLAYNEIKDRKGTLVNGSFIKE